MDSNLNETANTLFLLNIATTRIATTMATFNTKTVRTALGLPDYHGAPRLGRVPTTRLGGTAPPPKWPLKLPSFGRRTDAGWCSLRGCAVVANETNFTL